MCNSGDTVAVCAGWSCVGALNVVRRQVGAVQLRVRCSLAGRVLIKLGEKASRSGSPALNDPTLTNLVRNYPYNMSNTKNDAWSKYDGVQECRVGRATCMDLRSAYNMIRDAYAEGSETYRLLCLQCITSKI